MLEEAFKDMGDGIYIQSRQNADLFTVAHFRAKAKTTNILVRDHNVSIRVKGKIYRAITLSTLLYGAETWTVSRRHVKKLHAFMMRHLRLIMKIRWQDKVTNIKVLKRAGLPSMEDLLIRKNLRRTGHLLRMPTDRLPRQVLYSQLPDGQRPRGRPRPPLQRHNQEKPKEKGY